MAGSKIYEGGFGYRSAVVVCWGWLRLGFRVGSTSSKLVIPQCAYVPLYL